MVHRKGFTLIELLFATVIAISAGILIARVYSADTATNIQISQKIVQIKKIDNVVRTIANAVHSDSYTFVNNSEINVSVNNVQHAITITNNILYYDTIKICNLQENSGFAQAPNGLSISLKIDTSKDYEITFYSDTKSDTVTLLAPKITAIPSPQYTGIVLSSQSGVIYYQVTGPTATQLPTPVVYTGTTIYLSAGQTLVCWTENAGGVQSDYAEYHN